MVFFVSGESVKWLHPLKNIRNPEVTMDMVCDGLFVCICLFVCLLVGWLVRLIACFLVRRKKE